MIQVSSLLHSSAALCGLRGEKEPKRRERSAIHGQDISAIYPFIQTII